MMNETVSYGRISISDILKDSIIASSETLERASTLKMPADSYAKFRYSWSSEKDVLTCPSLRIAYSMSETTRQKSTRYSVKILIEVKIHYYVEESTEGGNWQVITVIPEFSTEKNYAGYADIPIETTLIKEMILTIKNNSDGEVELSYVKILRGRDGNQTVTDTYGLATTLKSIDTYENGCKVYYDDSEGVPTIIVFSSDEDDNLTGVTVNPNTESERYIPVTKYSGDTIEI